MNALPLRRPLRLLVLALAAGLPALAAASGPPAAPAPAPGAAAPVAQRSGPVTEQEATALIREVENAARARSVDRLAATLAEDVAIELRTTIDGREHVTQFGKSEYIGMLTNGYAAMRDLEGYDYVVADLAFAADGAAMIARSRVLEAATFGGRTSVTESSETTRVERRDGRVLIAAVTATTTGAPATTSAR